MTISNKCHCGNIRSKSSKYCLACKAEYMRDWRKLHPLTDEQKIKDNARSYAGVYLRRGKLKREPCKICGLKAQMHHNDYTKPLEITWLCRDHHLEHHRSGV